MIDATQTRPYRLPALAPRVSRILLALLLTFVAAPSIASAQGSLDRVRRLNGVDSGKVITTTALGLTISKGGVDSTIPAEEIESVTFGGEPGELAAARNAMQAGRLQDGIELLQKITPGEVEREEVQAEVDFSLASAKAQLAMSGQGDLAAAAAEMRSFLSKRNKSFHVPRAIELLGDLLAASGEQANARAEYAKLAKAKSTYYQLNSALLVGRTWQAEGDHAQAQAEFDKVIASTDDGQLIKPLKLAATLDRAVSQAATGNVKEATAAIGDIIAKANPDDAKLLARAHNALGDSYLQSGDPRGALYAYLHVDLLYNQDPEAHAKALHELSQLWKKVGRDSRAQEAADELATKYPGSRWAKPSP